MEILRGDRIDQLAFRFGQALASLRAELVGPQAEPLRRIADLESQVKNLQAEFQALRPLVNGDELTAARLCQEVGLDLAGARRHTPCRARAQAVHRVFCRLRELGWSLDRIGRVFSYSGRGISKNLRRFA